MLRATLKDLAARRLRLLTTSIAVLLGVAFMCGSLVLTDTIGRTFDALFADVNAGTDVHVRAEAALASEDLGVQRARLDLSLATTIAEVDGVAAAEPAIQAYAQPVGRDGEPLGTGGVLAAPSYGASWLEDTRLNPFELVDGRAPATDGEVVLDRGSARAGGYSVGDRATVLTQAGELPVTVVGIATFGSTDSPGGAAFTFFTLDAAQQHLTAPGMVDAIKVVGEDGLSDEELVRRVGAVLPERVEALTGAAVTAEEQSDVAKSLTFFNTFLVSFALIALFVGSFIIYNSFSIQVAQRGRDLALLRAIGASRGQVLLTVLLEAVAVGAIASVAGLVAGMGVATLLRALMATAGFDLPPGDLVLTRATVVTGIVAGLGVSVASAFFPARRASRVEPLAALRDVARDTSGSSRRRVVLGLLLVAAGALSIADGLVPEPDLGPAGLGAALVFVGVVVLGPILARPLSRALGAPLSRLRGMAGTLARENAMRNPRRTASTAAALMIGVALVGFITVVAASTKATVAQALDTSFQGDLVVYTDADGAGGLSPTLASEVTSLDEVDAAVSFRVSPALVDGVATSIIGADHAAVHVVFDLGVTAGSLADLGAGTIAVQAERAATEGWKVGDRLSVQFAETGEQALTIAALYAEKDVLGPFLVGLATYEANVADQFDLAVFVKLADGVDLEAGLATLTEVADRHPLSEVLDRSAFEDTIGAEIDSMLNLIYVLLGLAVVIALLGIANTLALSIFERTRELGLLRAVGMTRAQVRAAVRWESVIIALLGTSLGLAVGTSFSWVMGQALADEGLSAFVVPVGQLAVIVLIAAASGVAAGVLPARRAARLDVLEAIGAQ